MSALLAPDGALGFDQGYIVFGPTGTIRFSTDGDDWTEEELPVEQGAAIGVRAGVASGNRVVLVGSSTPCPIKAYETNPFHACRARPASWVSNDGRIWEPAQPWKSIVGEAGRRGSAFVSVWSIDPGWESAQAFDLSDDSDDFGAAGPALWQSGDGLAWSEITRRLPDLEAGCLEWDANYFRVLADDSGRRLASGGCQFPEGGGFWISTDGLQYEPLPASTPAGASAFRALPAAGAAPWLLGGSAPGTDGRDPVIWSSSDLATWTATGLPKSQAVTRSTSVIALSRGDDLHLAVGMGALDDVSSVAVTWISEDGVSWWLADVRGSDELAIGSLVTGPAGTIAIGTVMETDGLWSLKVWRLERVP